MLLILLCHLRVLSVGLLTERRKPVTVSCIFFRTVPSHLDYWNTGAMFLNHHCDLMTPPLGTSTGTGTQKMSRMDPCLLLLLRILSNMYFEVKKKKKIPNFPALQREI